MSDNLYSVILLVNAQKGADKIKGADEIKTCAMDSIDTVILMKSLNIYRRPHGQVGKVAVFQCS